jgi:hypothetical protein
MGHLILYASVIVVAALAMRPKLSLALMSTVPVGLALVESRAPGGLPDWLLISGMLVTAYCVAAVTVALLLRRSGDIGGSFGSLPVGREASYSSPDKMGLWSTFAMLCVAVVGSAVAAVEPPYGSQAVRILAVLLVPAFAALAATFWQLLKDRDLAVRITENALEISRGSEAPSRVPWSDVAGYTFWFGIFRVYDKSGHRILRVDNTIDGFVTLLYHVNRRTFRGAS